MWVLPIFLQPGKVDFFIRSMIIPQDNSTWIKRKTVKNDLIEMFYSRHVIEIREERVPYCKWIELGLLITIFFA